MTLNIQLAYILTSQAGEKKMQSNRLRKTNNNRTPLIFWVFVKCLATKAAEQNPKRWNMPSWMQETLAWNEWRIEKLPIICHHLNCWQRFIVENCLILDFFLRNSFLNILQFTERWSEGQMGSVEDPPNRGWNKNHAVILQQLTASSRPCNYNT